MNINIVRHSLAHIMAYAIQELYPKTKFGIGPAIENGFYYDVETIKPIKPEDLSKIEEKMRELTKKNLEFRIKRLEIKEVKKIFKNQPYKLELIKELKEKKATIYESGDFIDLCKGPHIKSSKEIPFDGFKLTKIAGAYWRGKEKNNMLTRIYGVAFSNKKELNDYLNIQAEAEKRDHRIIGQKLDLFIFSDLVGSGLPLYTFKGAAILREIKNYSNQLQKEIGYQEVQTPNMNRAELFKISGHYEKFKDEMFKVISHYSKEDYYLKPMNCPQHTQIYASKMRSYKELPIRIADFANLYRDEKTGELSGLSRLRGFCQDDGHCFCAENQIQDEFKAVLSVIEKAMKTYQMDYKIRLSLWDPKHPEKYLGDKKVWEKSQKLLREILIKNKIDYFEAVGEAAMYGPKMDLISKDSLNREWQLSTIQLDFIMPQRFGLKYIDSDGKEKTPVMIHRAIVGSPERFFGILLEHYAGSFPVWLSPVQVWVVPVGDNHKKYAKEIYDKLSNEGIRAELKDDNNTISKKIREGEIQKIPYLLIVGDKEIKSDSVAVRERKKGDVGMVKIDEFIEQIKKEISEKR